MTEKIKKTIAKIGQPDAAAMEKVRKHWDSLAKPQGSLGKGEELLVKIAGIQKSERIHIGKRVLVIFCADTTVTRPPRENPNAPAVTSPNPIWRDDMGACTENFLLAAEACGLGAVWTACYPFHDRMDPVAAYLQLPGNIVPYSIVPVGYPAGDEQPKDKWDESRIHFDKF